MLFCNLSFSQERKFKKNYKYLNKWKFEKAYKNLNDIRFKDSNSPFLFYLLSLYFSDKNNVDRNIDSSYLYLKKSLALSTSYPDKKELDESCEEIKYCILNLPAQLDSISNVAYEICLAKNDITSLRQFINLYKGTFEESKAMKRLDQLLYYQAKENKSISTLVFFVANYPNSDYIDSAKKYIENISYLDAIKKDEIDTYNRFLKQYPNSNVYTEIELKRDKKAFDLAVLSDSENAYNTFISTYPKSTFVKEAILKRDKKAFDLAILSNSETGYNSFIAKYPKSTFVKEAIAKRNKKVYDEAKTKNDLINFIILLQKYPDIEYAKDINENIIKLEKKLMEPIEFRTGINEVNLKETPPENNMFASKIKKQILFEQGEIKAVNYMVELLHVLIQNSFDYKVISGEPKSLDEESKNWEIPLVVTATANENMDFCANYCLKTFSELSLSSEEVTSYRSLNKAVYSVVLNYKGFSNTFYLRKKSSVDALQILKVKWEFYTRLFTVQSGLDASNGNGKGKIHDFINSGNYSIMINFLTKGQQAAIFTWQDKRTLSQIELMKSGYKVKPRGVVSQFKHDITVAGDENYSQNLIGDENAKLDAPEVSGKVRAVVKTKVEKNDEILEFVEQMPEFPGGEEALFAYIQKNLKYPQQAVDANATGRVTINFVVNDDGSITDVKLARGIGYGLDEEAIRVVRGLPKWNPGKLNGKKVRVAYSLPITFQLD
jgi:TonB family protein